MLTTKLLTEKHFECFRRKFSRQAVKKWKSVVGLEVHAQINSKSKLFSSSSTEFASPVNSNVSLFDCGMPGTLPVLNKKCVEYGVLTALALNCKVNPVSMFDRKHYFYSDLPKGYQITQQRMPLAGAGHLEFQVSSPAVKRKRYISKARIKQIQLEEDSGRSLHFEDRSLIDLNRAGIPLMEVVFEPDLTDGEEAASLIKELILILKALGTCSCKMEEGALRVDANVSVHQEGEPLGVRTEVKNIGSVRGVAGAISYEIERQIKLLDNGDSIINETRAWDALGKVTVPMRDKEGKQDYRFMPEPNLPPLRIAMGPVKWGCVNADSLKGTLPELPAQTRLRLVNNYGLTLEQAFVLVNEPKLLHLFSEIIKDIDLNPTLVVNLLMNDFLTLVHNNRMHVEELIINVEYFKDAILLYQKEVVNRKTLIVLFEEILNNTTEHPSKIVASRGLMQISNENELEKLCQDVMNANPKIVMQYKNGKTKVFKAFMGIISKESQQRANMSKVNDILKKLLDK